MPHDVQQPNKPNKPPNPKGKPLGIPKWGWAAAIGIGLLIGIVLLKRSGSSAASGTGSDAGSNSSPLGSNDSGSGGGVVASPPPPNSPGVPTVTTEQQIPQTPYVTPGGVEIGTYGTTATKNIDLSNTQPTNYVPPTATAGGYTVPAPVAGAPTVSTPISYSTGHGPQIG